MINLLSAFRRDDHPIRLNREFHLDLSWWLEFFQSWNGYNFLLSPLWAPILDLHVSSDAAGSVGYGAIHSFVFTARHIPEKSKAIADAISRFEFQRFHQLAPYASPTATLVPPLVLDQLPVVETKSANFISPTVWLLQRDGCIVQHDVSSSISVH